VGAADRLLGRIATAWIWEAICAEPVRWPSAEMLMETLPFAFDLRSTTYYGVCTMSSASACKKTNRTDDD
jgi:hypothetical protein